MPKRKTGLMYSRAFETYNAGEGYLCIPAGQSPHTPWTSTGDYCDTPERVTEAYGLLEKSGLLDRLEAIASRPATMKELAGFHSAAYIEKLKRLSEGEGGLVGESCQADWGWMPGSAGA